MSWKQRLGPQVTLRDASTLTPSFVGRLAGRYQFQGVAVCGSLTSAPAVLEATIRNVPPRANAGPWVALDDPTSATPSFVPRQPGTYVFELEVDAQKIRSAAATVSVVVSSEGVAR